MRHGLRTIIARLLGSRPWWYAGKPAGVRGTRQPTLEILEDRLTPSVSVNSDVYCYLTNTPLVVEAGAGVLRNDSGLQTLRVAAHTSPEHGTLVMQPAGGFQYTPDPGYTGPDHFTYTVTSGSTQATGVVTLGCETSAYGVYLRAVDAANEAFRAGVNSAQVTRDSLIEIARSAARDAWVAPAATFQSALADAHRLFMTSYQAAEVDYFTALEQADVQEDTEAAVALSEFLVAVGPGWTWVQVALTPEQQAALERYRNHVDAAVDARTATVESAGVARGAAEATALVTFNESVASA